LQQWLTFSREVQFLSPLEGHTAHVRIYKQIEANINVQDKSLLVCYLQLEIVKFTDMKMQGLHYKQFGGANPNK
jgi:hypothetical protein